MDSRSHIVHEGHEEHEEKILRKIGLDSLPLPNGAVVPSLWGILASKLAATP